MTLTIQKNYPEQAKMEQTFSSSYEESLAGEIEESSQVLANDDEWDAEEEAEKNASLAKRETKAISYLRCVVFLVLVAAAAVVCVLVYNYVRASEEERFESSFEDHSTKVIDAFQSNAARRVAAIDSLSMAYTSHAIDTGAEWPMVTLPDYERRASRIMDLADVIAIFQYPLVTAETRSDYEAYALDNQGWLQEGLEQRQQEIVQRIAEGSTTLEDEADNLAFLESFLGDGESHGGSIHSIPSEIYQPMGAEVGPEDGPGPYFPVWQWAPALPVWDLVNFNAVKGPSHTNELKAILETEQVVTSRAFDFSDETDPDVFGRKPLLNLILSRWKGGGKRYQDGPVSDLYYPIYDSFNTTTRKLVAVFDTLIYWQVYFVNVLVNGAEGIVVVLENNCDQAFTYEINGPEATYVGAGDLHDPAYDKHEVSTGFGAFLGHHTNHPLNDTRHCMYNVRVYPSKQMEDQYSTDAPFVFTIILVGVFFFTSLVFIIYDRLVERRQHVVLETAKKSSHVVEQLFPKQVREGLYNGTKSNSQLKNDEELSILGFVDGTGKAAKDAESDNMPNAFLYEDCTVFFADLVGFTRWSAGREAPEVFKLLEMLYGAFDRIASKRNVFKVETIGDCYMAVTGVPKAQSDHAVRMARFAHECLVKMNQMKSRLVASLGPEAGELAIRIGLHSGNVTGGVLRGSKARFQLFGDSVNTAARMESNGKPWKIQASPETADFLLVAGKADWVRPREEMIEPKGKGAMQTYWVEIGGEGSSRTADTSSMDDSGVHHRLRQDLPAHVEFSENGDVHV